MTWSDFFETDHSIYVNARHKALHADIVARGVAGHIPKPDARVLDYGCGEALGAAHVAARCGRLFLYDSAFVMRSRLRRIHVADDRIKVLDETTFDELPHKSLDMIAVVSVLQYVGGAEFARLLSTFHDKLADGGLLVLGDIVPRDLTALEDARALLSFGWSGGFFFAALAGLAKTALSDYRTLRETYGLSTYDEADMAEILADHDFSCERAPENIGHNQRRMTFVARKLARD